MDSQVRLNTEQRRREDYHNQYLNPDNYIEEPRPNLFNVIKKLRETDNKVSKVKYMWL